MGLCFGTNNHIIKEHLLMPSHEDILLKNKYSSNPTPMSRLMKVPISIYECPKFVIDFYSIVHNKEYLKIVQNKYKDVFFCVDVVYSVEVMEKCVYESMSNIHDLTRHMKHVLTPYSTYYHQLHGTSGIVFQKTKRCNMGDLWNIKLKEKNTSIDIDNLIWSLATTLKELHTMEIYLFDIKLENIFAHYYKGSVIWMFADIEYAWVKPPFLELGKYHSPQEEMKRRSVGSRYWVKTLEYLPDRMYPWTKCIAVRNDCFALARCISTCIYHTCTDSINLMFYGNKELIIYDLRQEVKEQFPFNTYLHICGDCIVEHNKYATVKFLDTLIELSLT